MDKRIDQKCVVTCNVKQNNYFRKLENNFPKKKEIGFLEMGIETSGVKF